MNNHILYTGTEKNCKNLYGTWSLSTTFICNFIFFAYLEDRILLIEISVSDSE